MRDSFSNSLFSPIVWNDCSFVTGFIFQIEGVLLDSGGGSNKAGG